MSRVRNTLWIALLTAIMICWCSEAIANEQVHGYQIPTTEGAVTPTIGICKTLGTTATGRNGRRRAGSTSRRSFGASYCLPYTDSGPRKLGFFFVPPEVVKAIENVELDLITHFEHDSTTLKELEGTSVDVLVDWLINTEDAGIKLTGHTDSTGTPEYNLELSLRRTEAVKAFFVAKGVPTDRIETEGLGETSLFMDIIGRLRENRRVTIETFQVSNEE
jgi:outer membrane protein OmpA-like peptidoglycan-associated protein